MTKPAGRTGRQPGTKNKRTVEREAMAQAAAAAVEAVIPGAFAGDAHAFLIAVYKDPGQPMEIRLDAAKAAVRYEKPALAAVDVTSLGEQVAFAISAEPLDRDGTAWLAKHGGSEH